MHRLDLALRALDRLRHHRRLNGLVVGHVRLLHHAGDGIHAVTAEQAHEVVFEREVELRRARVALASRTAAQLVVDTARLVALGADDAQAARGEHLLVFLFANGARTNECLVAFLIRRRRGCVLGDLLALDGLVVDMARGIEAPLAQHVLGEHVGVAAEQDVRAAACHVGRDGHCAHAAGLRDDVSLALVVLRVQSLVLDAALVQKTRQALGALDRDRADQAGLARLVARRNVVGDGIELCVDRAIDQVVLVDTGDGPVRRDGDDRQLVDLAELLVLGHGGTGHARKLLVEAEVVLQRDGRKRLVLFAHEHVLFRLERLMEALGVAATLHDAARELVDDLHFPADDDVIDVAMEEELRL